MSSLTEQLNTGQQANFKRDTSKIFIWDNRYETMTFINNTGGPLTVERGALLGRISASGNVRTLVSSPPAGSEGCERPVGILASSIKDLADAGTVEVSVCVSGDVAAEKLILQGADTLDTVIASRRLRDRIGADTVGIRLITTNELTGFDNE